MGGDYSRHGFDPRRDFGTVLMQQGRVALDSDWNELAAITDRRLKAETVDIIGRCVVPRETIDGFRITIAGTGSGKTMNIGRGRIYVHGLLAENHGVEPFSFDLATLKPDGSGPVGVLAESIGSGTISYAAQPFLPQPPALPAGDGPHLIYLDVWQREVTWLENETLLEPALGGVDTTTRLQTAWQVRVLPNVGAGTTCASADADIPGWIDLTRPSAGRLSVIGVPVDAPDDPCIIPPGGGFKGLENQLYRVEIHNGGPPGTATFKWSRDNANIAANVVAIPTNDTITVTSIGRDAILRFNQGDWVELTDDRREFAGQPGFMRRITLVEDELRRITLLEPFPAELTPSNVGNDTLARRHTRVRRWDQHGVVRDVGDNQLVDLNDLASHGVIPITAAGMQLVIEKGVQVTFEVVPAGGVFKVGDYWCFAARTASASVEELSHEPPRGVHHHYCRLAVVTFPDQVHDCRVFWPPEFDGEGCGCSVCVTPESHNSGTLPIQQAIDTVAATGGTVCLDAGSYTLGATSLRVQGAKSVRIVGQGPATELAYTGSDAAIIVDGSQDITLDSFAIQTLPRIDLATGSVGGGSGIRLRNSLALTVERCVVATADSSTGSATGIALEAFVLGARLRTNRFVMPNGIIAVTRSDEEGSPYVATFNVTIHDNDFECSQRGIALQGMTFLFGATDVSANRLTGCRQGGIVVTGAAFATPDPENKVPQSFLEICGNTVYPQGDGIVVGTHSAAIRHNHVTAFDPVDPGSGVVLVEGLVPAPLADIKVIGNRLDDMPRFGIHIKDPVAALMIKQNTIERAGAGGIIMDPDATIGLASIENNFLVDIAQATGNDEPVSGFRLVRIDELSVVANTLRGFGRKAANAPSRAAIDIVGCRSVAVTGNELADIGSEGSLEGLESDGIRVAPPFEIVRIAGNAIRRSLVVEGDQAANLSGGWVGINVMQNARFAFARSIATFPAILETDKQLFVIGLNRFVAVPRSAEPHLNIDGNQIVSLRSDLPVVRVSAAVRCIVGSNQCRMLGPSRATELVFVQTTAVSLCHNVVRRLGEQDCVRINTDPRGNKFSILGNMTSGRIMLDGTPLSGVPGDWAKFNVIEA